MVPLKDEARTPAARTCRWAVSVVALCCSLAATAAPLGRIDELAIERGQAIAALGRLVELLTPAPGWRLRTGQMFGPIGPSSIRIGMIQVLDLSTRQYTLRTLQPAGNPNASGSGTQLSRNGQCVVGHQDAGFFTPFHALRWTEADGPADLGTLDPANPNASSFATDVATDCSVVVGFSDVPGGFTQQAFRWTATGGLASLGVPAGAAASSRAMGVSGDGTVVVGDAGFVDGSAGNGVRNGAFRWSAGAGFQALGALEPGWPSLANAVSADGAVIVGQAGVSVTTGSGSSNGTRPFRWTAATGMQDIGTPAGFGHGAATAVSDDGRVVAGILSDGPVTRGNLGYAGGSGAFRWTEATGSRDLRQLLIDAGVDMTGITLLTVSGMSPDGQWIQGAATTPDTAPGETVGYVVQYCDDAADPQCRPAGTIGVAPGAIGLAASSATLTIPAGGSATTTLTITPGTGFTGSVTFECAGLPAGAACSFSPATVTPTTGPVTTQLTITTNGGAIAAGFAPWSLAALGLLVAASGLTRPGRTRSVDAATLVASARSLPLLTSAAAIAAIAGAGLGLSACGGGGTGDTGTAAVSGTPAGTTTLSVIAVYGSGATASRVTLPINLTVTR